MKWSITQLRKYQGQPFKFNQTVTFNHLIQNLDLLDLSPIDIEGELIVKSNEVVATMHLTGQYKMACAYVSACRCAVGCNNNGSV